MTDSTEKPRGRRPGNGPAKGESKHRERRLDAAARAKANSPAARRKGAATRKRRVQAVKQIEERAREIMADKGIGFVAAKMEAWRERQLAENPNYRDPIRPMNKAEIEELARSFAPDALKAAYEMLQRTDAMAQNARARVIEILLDRGIGKPTQPVEVTTDFDNMTDEELIALLKRETGNGNGGGGGGSGSKPAGA